MKIIYWIYEELSELTVVELYPQIKLPITLNWSVNENPPFVIAVNKAVIFKIVFYSIKMILDKWFILINITWELLQLFTAPNFEIVFDALIDKPDNKLELYPVKITPNDWRFESPVEP